MQRSLTCTRVLLIEDDLDTAEAVRHLIDGPDIHVKRASTLGQGLALLISWSPDAILLDLVLPDSHDHMSTYQTIRRYAVDTPVIVLTNVTSPRLTFDLMQDGADNYLQKCHSLGGPEALRDAIIAAIDRRKQAPRTIDRHSGPAARLWAWGRHEGQFWHRVCSSNWSRRASFAAILMVVAAMTPVIVFGQDNVLKDVYEGRLQSMREYLDLMKWGATAIVLSLVAAVGVLFRALMQEKTDRTAATEAAWKRTEANLERVVTALADASVKVGTMASEVGRLAEKIDEETN